MSEPKSIEERQPNSPWLWPVEVEPVTLGERLGHAWRFNRGKIVAGGVGLAAIVTYATVAPHEWAQYAKEHPAVCFANATHRAAQSVVDNEQGGVNYTGKDGKLAIIGLYNNKATVLSGVVSREELSTLQTCKGPKLAPGQ